MMTCFRLLLFSGLYSYYIIHLKAAGTSCQDICRYNDYARDAECTNRGLTTIPTPCTRAHALDMSYNSLPSVPAASFLSYRQLRYLHLENNQIASISPGAFDSVKRSLRQANLSNNHIEEIQANTFVNMTLQYLLLSDNWISRIDPGAFKGMARLLKLYLGNNRLTSLEYSIFNNMPNLLEVNLRNNMIVSVDLSFVSNLPHMQKIFLQNNSISDLTGHVTIEQTRLTLINLSQNQLQSFDCSVMSNLFGLSDLYLTDNSLQTIEGCNLHQMSTLNVSGNRFHCDCSLRTLFTWLQRYPDSPSPNCSGPENLEGSPVRDAPLESCPEDEESSTESTSFWMNKHTTTLKRSTKHLQTSSSQDTHENHMESTVGFTPFRKTLLNQMTRKGDTSLVDNAITHGLLEAKEISLGSFEISGGLFAILVTIVILAFFVIVLFPCCVKYYCIRSRNENEKKRKEKKMYYGTSHSSLEDAKDAAEHLTGNHNYESISENHLRTTNRQQSFDSQRSSEPMLPGQMTLSTESYPRSSGFLNYSLRSHHICTCECHEDISEESGSFEECHGSSCSDVSYEMDNHINEVSESGPSIGNCCYVDHQVPVNHSRTLDDRNSCRHSHERNVHINFTSSLGGRYPPSMWEGLPPVPPLPPKKADNEVYIQHNKLHLRPETNALTGVV